MPSPTVPPWLTDNGGMNNDPNPKLSTYLVSKRTGKRLVQMASPITSTCILKPTARATELASRMILRCCVKVELLATLELGESRFLDNETAPEKIFRKP
jgi:hypothetical protein